MVRADVAHRPVQVVDSTHDTPHRRTVRSRVHDDNHNHDDNRNHNHNYYYLHCFDCFNCSAASYRTMHAGETHPTHLRELLCPRGQ